MQAATRTLIRPLSYLRSKLMSLSIFSKLVLAFLLVLIPLNALSLSMNQSGSNSVRAEISKLMTSRVHFYMDSLETEFARIISQGQEYIVDDDLQRLSIASEVMSEINIWEATMRLKKRLELLKSSSPYIRNVSAFIPALDRTISSNEYISRMSNEEFQAMLAPTNRYESPFLMWKDRLFISFPYPDNTVMHGTPPLFVLSVEISKDKIAKALNGFGSDDEGGVVLYSGKPALLVASDSEAAVYFKENLEQADAYNGSGLKSIKVGEEKVMVAFEASTKFDFTLFIYLPEKNVLGPLKQYRIGLWLLSCLSVVIIVCFSFFIFRLIHKPLKKLIQAFREVERGNLTVVVNPFKDEFRYLYDHFNEMVGKLNVLVHEVYEQKYRVRSSELRQLQSQINPHFLYNSFFILYRMAKIQDYENIVQFTKFLSEYYQFITRTGAEFIPLETEVAFVKTYADIQTIRFSNRIQAEFGEVPASCLKVTVPRLILQPLVENAYNHGMENKLSTGKIVVSFEERADLLVIAVEDNGDTLTDETLDRLITLLKLPAEEAESTGLINVHRRIRIKFGAQYGLAFSRGTDGGLKAQLTIPIPKEDDGHA
ncbi:sensor histidine kinase [Cohnella nanjingensis]|uniref:Histidine kinase n=1 Tax=Cohnella nanjingensis TaxID=1387779 RepID=A0A7X0RWV4_9BACL|nr:histidine kinase [Cohnella nanjingensis]MBB6673800.1 histidine kinase [Cohnella nanjingensis]